MRIISFLYLFLAVALTNISAQCDVFIEPGSVEVVDNGTGVQFRFDITNNSGVDWYGDVLKMYWSLNSSAPIWNIDYSTDVNQPPIAPGETRTIKTPWFDIPNLPSWFPDDPTTAQPWEESMEWPYYGLSFPFQGAWSQMNLRLGSCGLADGAWVHDDNGDAYYGPFNTDCPDLDNDAFCDCDLEIVGFNPSSLDIEVEVVSHWNCGQPLNGLDNSTSANIDGINMIHFGIHVPGWDFQWGCTTDINHPGWSFTGWSTSDESEFLLAGDVFQENLNNLIPPNSCFEDILSNDSISECREIVLWQINYSQTLSTADGGWALNPLDENNTQEYPDNTLIDNTILICEIPVEGCIDPFASNYNPDAEVDDGSCEYLFPDADPNANFNDVICNGEEAESLYNVFVYNPGSDTLFYYCVEIPEIGFDECYNGYQSGNLWIEPGAGQFIGTFNIPSDITQFTIIVYNAEGEQDDDNSNNTQIVNVTPPNETICIDPIELDLLGEEIWSIGGTCTDPYFNQSFVVENTGEAVVDSFLFDIFVTTWDNQFVSSLSQTFYPSLEPGEQYTINNLPNIFTGDLNYVFVSVSWYDETGELVVDTQSFNVIIYCWGCTDPEANNYIDSPYVFDEIQDYWTNDFPNITPPTPDQIECTYDIYGCTDPLALNYEPDANIDDGSCEYNVFGCTDPAANNYNADATIDDGSCEYDIYGCTDSDAINYDSNATIDDGSCMFPGCTDPEADNYDPSANVDDGSCVYYIYGCTDSAAINYNPDANVDDGNCIYNIYGCTDSNAINYNPIASTDDGSCIYDPCDGPLGAIYFAPNTFTPNNDGINDGWAVISDPSCWLRWNVYIFNRWGQLVWESTTPGEVWPGSTFSGGYYVADGIYFYKVKGIGYNPANTFETTGHVTVFR